MDSSGYALIISLTAYLQRSKENTKIESWNLFLRDKLASCFFCETDTKNFFYDFDYTFKELGFEFF
jgi:hypothetical protein